MSAEIICVGTELLLGDIVNTNAQYLAQELARLGIPHYFQTVVGDNSQRLQSAIAIATSRASLLIFTGGLGPTPDDLTTEAISSYFSIPLIEQPEIIRDMEEKFRKTGREMVACNRKQALLPQGADILPNPSGTAPGLIWQPRPNLTLLTFPGVPSEMKRMWQETAIPFLKSQGWGKEIIFSRLLKFRGIGESSLAEKVQSYFDLTQPTVAPYASLGEVKLRVSARAKSEDEAIALIDPVARALKKIGGLDYMGCDDDTLASVVGELLKQRGETLAVAESCTGGGLGAMITAIAGSSDYFLGGSISYANAVKVQQLAVNDRDLINQGAVSEIVAQQMALGAKQAFQSNWSLSITGIAGPGGGSDDKPVGLVYIGIADPQGVTTVQQCQFGDRRDRETIRYLSACAALDGLRRSLLCRNS